MIRYQKRNSAGLRGGEGGEAMSDKRRPIAWPIPGQPMSHWHGWLAACDEPEERTAFSHAAVEAFERLTPGEVDADDLSPIIRAAFQRWKLVYESGLSLLMYAAAREPAAQDALRELVESRRCETRYRVIACLSTCLPHSLLMNLLRRGLDDRSHRVRRISAQQAGSLRLMEMVGTLRSKLNDETHPRVRDTLIRSAAFLTKGHVVESNGSDSWTLIIGTPAGWTCHLFESKPSEQDIQAALRDED